MAKKTKKEVNVVCIKWGTLYNEKTVNILYNMVTRNTSFKVNFYCFTDNKKGLLKDIIAHPLPKMNMKKEDCKYSYVKEAGLCDDNLGGLKGQRAFFFDLDILIIDNIDELFTFPKGDKFYTINDWNTKGDHVGQASCYSWKVGTLGSIKEYFEKNSKECVDRFFTASQEYLSFKVIEKYGKLNFWPDTWIKSFRFHCLPLGIFRSFITAKIPKNVKIIAFHGNPKMEYAIVGKWHGSGKKEKLWKKVLYKRLRPVPWIKDYYR